MTLDDWNDGREEGRQEGQADMLAMCIGVVEEYALTTHKHVGIEQCWPESGDRCDITAALRVAISRLRALQEKP